MRFRRDLREWLAVQQVRQPIGESPSTFESLVAEWEKLSRSTTVQMDDLRQQHERWQQRLIKSKKSAPKIPEGLWQDIDRLSLLYERAPILREAFVADQLRDRSEASRVVLAAETERRHGAQEEMFAEAQQVVREASDLAGLAAASWIDSRWQLAHPAIELLRCVQLGDLELQLPEIAGMSTVPAFVGFPFKAGLCLDAGVAQRDQALGLIRSLVMRLLTAIPPGRAHFVVFDPVSLGQSVAEFRHLANSTPLSWT